MADLAVWQRTIVDEEGNVIPGAEIEVRREEDGSLATLYADRAGETPLANPLAADMSGFVRFFAQGDAYTITAVGAGSTRTWRFDPTGRLQEFDKVVAEIVTDDAGEQSDIRDKLGTVSRTANLSDLTNAAEARSNLGTFSSVAEVQSRHIPAVLESIRTFGRNSPGDGPPLNLVRGSEVPGAVQSADGQWWEDVGYNTITVRIPTDFDTLQEAINHYSRLPMRQGATIDLLIESGHQLTHGLYVSDGDYGKFIIRAEDDLVEVSDSFVGAKDGEGLIYGDRCRMPTLACRIDMRGKPGSGYLADNNSTGHVLRNDDHYYGIINAGNNGLHVNRGSCVDAERSIWDGAFRSGIRVQQGSTVTAQFSHLNNCMSGGNIGDEGAAIASRGSTLHLQGAHVYNSGRHGVVCQRSWVNAQDINIENSTVHGLWVMIGSWCIANSSSIKDNGGSGVRVNHLSHVVLSGAEVTGNGSYDIELQNSGGGIVNITDTELSGPLNEVTNIPHGRRNVWTGRGVLSDASAWYSSTMSGPDWYRTADGFQVCWTTIEVDPVAFGSGTWEDPYRSDTHTWDFPVEFASPPTVTFSVSAGTGETLRRPCFVSCRQVDIRSATSVQLFRVGSNSSSTGTYVIHAVAVGRWSLPLP